MGLNEASSTCAALRKPEEGYAKGPNVIGGSVLTSVEAQRHGFVGREEGKTGGKRKCCDPAKGRKMRVRFTLGHVGPVWWRGEVCAGRVEDAISRR